MEDEEIIELFNRRDEAAISAVSRKFGNLCSSVSMNILHNSQDAEECVNDTFLKAWDNIPPQRPKSLSAYLAKIAKNVSLSRYRKEHTEKRGGGLNTVFGELEEFVVSDSRVEDTAERREILAAVNKFLEKLPEKKRIIFVRRYWYCDGADDIASRFGMTETNVFATLTRVRADLKAYLKKGGFLDE